MRERTHGEAGVDHPGPGEQRESWVRSARRSASGPRPVRPPVLPGSARPESGPRPALAGTSGIAARASSTVAERGLEEAPAESGAGREVGQSTAKRGVGRTTAGQGPGHATRESAAGQADAERGAGQAAADRRVGRTAADRRTGRAALDGAGRTAADRWAERMATGRGAGQVGVRRGVRPVGGGTEGVAGRGVGPLGAGRAGVCGRTGIGVVDVRRRAAVSEPRVLVRRPLPEAASPQGRVRRVVVGLAVVLAAAAVVFGLGRVADAAAHARVSAAPAVAEVTVTVDAPGTVWDVADGVAPSASGPERAAMVDRIVAANSLSSVSVRSGEVLRVPLQ
jgi:hypothetical protein